MRSCEQEGDSFPEAGTEVTYCEFGCELEVGNTSRLFGLKRKAEVFCLRYTNRPSQGECGTS